MSYEGYTQILCTNGHESLIDCYSEPNFDFLILPEQGDVVYQHYWTCHCGAKAVWWNDVDTTNGSFCDCPAGKWELNNFGNKNKDGKPTGCKYCDNGRIDGHVELEVDKPVVTQICSLGFSHDVQEQIYKIPKDRGYLTKWGKNGETSQGDR